jgi:predicted RNase H-like nuclease (RuvC/YqgF family)
MSVVLNFEKTQMIQPDMGLLDHYQTTKKDLARINNMKKVDEERITILREMNERLNTEVSNLKSKICKMSQNKEEPKGTSKDTAKLLSAVKILKSKYENEKKQRVLLSVKLEKLETLYDDTYDEEDSQPSLDTKNLEHINKNLSLLLKNLKQ